MNRKRKRPARRPKRELQLEQRLHQLQQRYWSDVRAKDDKIADLQHEIKNLEEHIVLLKEWPERQRFIAREIELIKVKRKWAQRCERMKLRLGRLADIIESKLAEGRLP